MIKLLVVFGPPAVAFKLVPVRRPPPLPAGAELVLCMLVPDIAAPWSAPELNGWPTGPLPPRGPLGPDPAPLPAFCA